MNRPIGYTEAMPLGTGYEQQACNLARALEVLGERWTMLVLRDCFFGVRRFTHLREHLDVSRAVLSERLNTLVDAGVLEHRAEGGRRVYVLTDAGVATWPILYSLLTWGQSFAPGATPSRTFSHTVCGQQLDEHGACPRCRTTPHPADLITAPGASQSTRTDPISLLLREPHRLLTPLEP